MAINLAEKYSSKVDERIKIKSYTGEHLNKDYEFNGVDTIHIYQIDTVALNDYTRSGASRYGTPVELGDSTQTLVLKQDKGFTFTIDKGNNQEQLNIKGAAAALKRETDEVIVPWIDRYRFAIFAAEVDSSMTDSTALTSANVYTQYLDAKEALAEIGVDRVVTYVTPAVYNLLKLDDNFIKASDMAQKMLIKGQMGEVDGDPIIMVAGKRLPAGIDFIMVADKTMISPVTLNDYKIHQDPPGINGNLVEGRFIMDAFILGSRAKAFFVQGARTSVLKTVRTDAYKATISGLDIYKGEKVYWKVASSSITASDIGDTFVTAGYTAGLEATGTSTNKYVEFVVVDRNGKVRDAVADELDA